MISANKTFLKLPRHHKGVELEMGRADILITITKLKASSSRTIQDNSKMSEGRLSRSLLVFWKKCKFGIKDENKYQSIKISKVAAYFQARYVRFLSSPTTSPLSPLKKKLTKAMLKSKSKNKLHRGLREFKRGKRSKINQIKKILITKSKNAIADLVEILRAVLAS